MIQSVRTLEIQTDEIYKPHSFHHKNNSKLKSQKSVMDTFSLFPAQDAGENLV